MQHLKINHIILIFSTIMIFLNLTVYLPSVGLFPFPAYLLDLIIFIFIVLFYLKKKLYFPYKNPFILWIYYYIILNITYYLNSPMSVDEFAFFKIFIFFTFMLFSFIFLFNLDDDNLTTTRKTLVVLGPIVTIMLGIDYFNPGYFYFGKEVSTFVVGRAASTYLNANLAGGAIVAFLIFGIDMIPKKLRILFILSLFLGVLFTMSRSNIMIFFLILIIMFFQKKFYTTHFMTLITTIILLFSWLGTGGLDTLADNYDLEVTENMKNRVNFFSDNETSDTQDMNERLEVLLDAIDMYTSNPIFGSGYASTRLWEHEVAPHNTFAMHWAEHGILGILLIPLMFFYASKYIFKFATKNQKQLTVSILIYFSFSCLFSHNVLNQPFQIASIIMIAVIGHKAQQKYFSERNDI